MSLMALGDSEIVQLHKGVNVEKVGVIEQLWSSALFKSTSSAFAGVDLHRLQEENRRHVQ